MTDADSTDYKPGELVMTLDRLAGLPDVLDALLAVAHAAWHVMDESGEVPGDLTLFVHSRIDHDRLDAALDALETTGWAPHEADQ